MCPCATDRRVGALITHLQPLQNDVAGDNLVHREALVPAARAGTSSLIPGRHRERRIAMLLSAVGPSASMWGRSVRENSRSVADNGGDVARASKRSMAAAAQGASSIRSDSGRSAGAMSAVGVGRHRTGLFACSREEGGYEAASLGPMCERGLRAFRRARPSGTRRSPRIKWPAPIV